MVVDSSALVAVLQDESTRAMLIEKLVTMPSIMAAPNLLEVHLVLKKFHGEETADRIREGLEDFNITVVPFTSEHAEEAMRAFDRFGKGRHPACLNFGDCIAYALARVSGQPLLFVGGDFSKTDIRVA